MEGDEQTEPEADGVFVQRDVADDGSISVEVRTVGDVRLTEVDTILALGRRKWRRQIGIE